MSESRNIILLGIRAPILFESLRRSPDIEEISNRYEKDPHPEDKLKSPRFEPKLIKLGGFLLVFIEPMAIAANFTKKLITSRSDDYATTLMASLIKPDTVILLPDTVKYRREAFDENLQFGEQWSIGEPNELRLASPNKALNPAKNFQLFLHETVTFKLPSVTFGATFFAKHFRIAQLPQRVVEQKTRERQMKERARPHIKRQDNENGGGDTNVLHCKSKY